MPAYLITNRILPGFRPSPWVFAACTAWFEQLGPRLETGQPHVHQNPAQLRTGHHARVYTLISAGTLHCATALARSHALMRFGGGCRSRRSRTHHAGRHLTADAERS